ncbi:hypothetical protein DSO57_1023364 [Entomophthora muscae]|uniref:Uncharacterized protein n=1 Tax=Entomophthora muscae TaxID=34485 RepID=A0ACC2S4Z9_9FUNG|nr:hypothetical protein DSO57_1023364 [Entomophthora muscae]
MRLEYYIAPWESIYRPCTHGSHRAYPSGCSSQVIRLVQAISRLGLEKSDPCNRWLNHLIATGLMIGWESFVKVLEELVTPGGVTVDAATCPVFSSPDPLPCHPAIQGRQVLLYGLFNQQGLPPTHPFSLSLLDPDHSHCHHGIAHSFLTEAAWSQHFFRGLDLTLVPPLPLSTWRGLVPHGSRSLVGSYSSAAQPPIKGKPQIIKRQPSQTKPQAPHIGFHHPLELPWGVLLLGTACSWEVTA